MCGQGGVAGTVTGTAELAFNKLLIMNSTRGIDSTGAASVKRELHKGSIQIEVAKEVGNPFNLFEVRRTSGIDYGDILSGTQRALLGHCRAKTVGGASRKNAHPFYFEDVVGTHNGTLSDYSHNKLEGKSKMDTDSEAIFYEINKNGIAETVKKFGEPDDAYALVWYDAKDNTINFLRNSKRPLWYAFSKDAQMIFWSSEKGHLVAAMEAIPHEEKYLSELPVDDHYSWEIPQVGKAFGKGHVVKRAQVIVPLVVTKKDWNSGTSGHNSHGGAGYYQNAFWTDPIFDKRNRMYRRYNKVNKRDEYSMSLSGVYYPSIVDCWNSLSRFQKDARIVYGEVPEGVVLTEIDKLAYPVAYSSDADADADEDKDKDKMVHLTANPSNVTEVDRKETKNIETAKVTIRERWLKEILQDQIHPMVYYEEERRVFWDIKEKRYIFCLFTGYKKEERWKVARLKQCPSFVPFKVLDINANHQFIHEGKKQKKVISYKGFNGVKLNLSTFEALMSSGCIECSRIPQWGNAVAFVNYTAFLCEYCSRDAEKVRAVKDAAKSA